MNVPPAPTDKLDPSAIAAPFVTVSVPALIGRAAGIGVGAAEDQACRDLLTSDP